MSKEFLANAIFESKRGWPHDAEWAAQDKGGSGFGRNTIFFYKHNPPMLHQGNHCWDYYSEEDIIMDSLLEASHVVCDSLCPDWDKTILSREEYFNIIENNWANWTGRDCPVSKDVTVEYKLDNEPEVYKAEASMLYWEFDDVGAITQYRIVEETPKNMQAIKSEEQARAEYKKPNLEELFYNYGKARDQVRVMEAMIEKAEADADRARKSARLLAEQLEDAIRVYGIKMHLD